MTGPNNNHDPNKDIPAATLEALGNAARAYASLTPNVNLAATGGFPPPLGVDASALLVNPAAAVASVVAAAAKQMAAQGQGNPAAPPVPLMAAAPGTIASPFAHPHQNVTVNHGHTTSAPSPAAPPAARSPRRTRSPSPHRAAAPPGRAPAASGGSWMARSAGEMLRTLRSA